MVHIGIEDAYTVAARVVCSAGTKAEAQVRHAFQFALGRPPRDVEWTRCLDFLHDQAQIYVSDKKTPEQAARKSLADLCHMLLSTNEFLYVE